MFKFKLIWIKKERIIPRWKLIGILFIAASFGFTLALSVQNVHYLSVILSFNAAFYSQKLNS